MQAAYDLNTARQKRQKAAPRLQVRRGNGRRKAAALRRAMTRAVVGAVMLMLVCSVIYSNVQLTELTGQIQDQKALLVKAESWNSYLTGELDSKTNMRNVEEIATGQLGMIKADPSQITYITLEEEGTIDRPAGGVQKLVGMLQAGILSLMDSVDP